MPPILTVEDLWVRFPGRIRTVEAVRGVSFEVGREKLGIVGESGSGKSMTGRAILRLVPHPGQVTARRLELAAPHMVELLPGHGFTDRLLDEGWGRSWGVFVTIPDPTILRRHLRRFLKVRDEAGRSLLFRFYDPRVLRVFLPTCRPDELAQLYGPITSYVAEGEKGATLLEFRYDGARLLTRTVAVDGTTSDGRAATPEARGTTPDGREAVREGRRE